jgi:hypothetical protein
MMSGLRHSAGRYSSGASKLMPWKCWISAPIEEEQKRARLGLPRVPLRQSFQEVQLNWRTCDPASGL